MKIWVSSLALAPRIASRGEVRRAVSLLSPGDGFPTFAHLDDDHHHRVALDDIIEPAADRVTPARGHVEQLISFLSAWSPDDPLLIHCWAGISRSTATAFVAACLHNPETDEAEIAQEIRAASPTAFPNSRIIGFADDILGRRGRMTEAAASIGRGEIAQEAEPFHIPSRFSRSAA